VNQQVTVQDQFGGAFGQPNVGVLNAAFICNPAVKKHGTRTVQIKHPSQHLVCYTTTTAQGNVNVQLQNQFGPRQLLANQRFMLCVPSQKTVVP